MELTTVPVISVIDDDASMRIAINNLVRSLGYIVHVFASAEAFLQSVQLSNTWCVIADVRMPAMSGVELQSHLRTQGNRVPFVFITAVPEQSVRDRAFKDGAMCFLTKPFDENDLIKCLGRAVERYRSGAGGQAGKRGG
jgi:FixJ family two-component response regulator